LLIQDGRILVAPKGSPKQYKHSTKKGRVTVPDHRQNNDLARGTENSNLKQAGLK